MKSSLFYVPALVVFLLFMSMAVPALAAGPTAAEYGVVINLSGKQRMLSQKMSKEVMLVALGVDVEQNLANLKETSELFDRTLTGLRHGDSGLQLVPTENKRILRQLDEVDAIWATFYPQVKAVLGSASVSPEQLSAIAAGNLPLLKEMNKAVGLYEADAKKGGLEADPGLAANLNLSGKQRMLTQKMSKEFFLLALGHDVDNNKLNLLETYTLFDRTLTGLVTGDETLGLPGTAPGPIVDQLDVVKGLWAGFQPLVASAAEPSAGKPGASEVRKVADANLPLLREMNKAVGLYADSAGK